MTAPTLRESAEALLGRVLAEFANCPFCSADNPKSWESGEHFDGCEGVALRSALDAPSSPSAEPVAVVTFLRGEQRGPVRLVHAPWPDGEHRLYAHPPAPSSPPVEAVAWPENVACGHCGHHPKYHIDGHCEVACPNPEDNPEACGCGQRFTTHPPSPAPAPSGVEVAREAFTVAARAYCAGMDGLLGATTGERSALWDAYDALLAAEAAENGGGR